eukprot:CAMPEP_0171600602 /NCGR_PEP_ID=MMETSP0990-20121206/4426_1 /TAXON_ID=483369 /ORGANISM="non described non described, Strain CCMP2098" /LENGTH=380 /DNA_ID=CAMNT_0012162601 /DNA_START=76 /DNA_END=1218 /DNA_ORIENTATION=-
MPPALLSLKEDQGDVLDAPYNIVQDPDDFSFRASNAQKTVTRIVLPTFIAVVLGACSYTPMSLFLKTILDTGELSILGNDSSQFIQNFLTVNGILFSMLTSNAFVFLYQQTESLYASLYAEVSEAKSLLEQITLICSGRPFYRDALLSIQRYVNEDLKRLDYSPATLLSNKPSNDPLETILYLTSVGVPSVVYDTVRSLRQARGQRLGATQRKLPAIHFYLLYFLAAIELLSFPLLGAGTASLFTESILTVQAVLFGFMAGAITMSISVIRELWNPIGGAYNVDGVLQTMVRGLEQETNSRLAGIAFSAPDAGPSRPPSFAFQKTTAAIAVAGPGETSGDSGLLSDIPSATTALSVAEYSSSPRQRKGVLSLFRRRGSRE